MPGPDATVQELLDLSAAYFGVPRERLAPESDLFETLAIDSLQALELISRLEIHFRIEIPDYELQDVRDFRGLASIIDARR